MKKPIITHIYRNLPHASYGEIQRVVNIAEKYYEDPETINEWEWAFLERIGIINDCGSSKCFLCHYISRKIFPYFVRASCKIHDFGHWLGWNEEERLRQNRGLYRKIILDVANNPNIWYFKNTYLSILANIFWLLTNIGSKSSFNYR